MNNTQRAINIAKQLQEAYIGDKGDPKDIPEVIQIPDVFKNNDTKIFYVPKYKSKNVYDLSSIPLGTEMVVIDTFDNKWNWHHLKELGSKETIKILYLGHDGLINGTEDDINYVINSLPNLEQVYYCGYYADYDDILERYYTKNVRFIPIE